MKFLFNNYRAMPLHSKVLSLVYLLVLALLPFIIGMKPANAQSGNVYGAPQAQTMGQVYEAVVVQIAIKEVEPSVQARAAGAAVGGALGMGLASRSNSQNRFVVNTVGAVLGGLLGERATSAMARTDAQELIVRLFTEQGQPPRTISIVQPAPFDAVYPGEMIYVTVIQGAWRVLRRATPSASAPAL